MLFPMLICCSSKSVDEPDPIVTPEEEEEEEEEPTLVIKAESGWDESLDGKGLDFVSGDEIGVYIINTTGNSYYNVRFSTEDGKSFTQPEGRTMSFDNSSKVYAYYPYVKDATRTLVKDVQVQLEQSGSSALKSEFFYTAQGVVSDAQVTLSFVPVQSVVNIELQNDTGKDLSLSSMSLEFESTVAGIFRHDLENDPLSDGFSMETLTGTTSSKIIFKLDSPVEFSKGEKLALVALVAPNASSTVKFQAYAGEGDYWKATISSSTGSSNYTGFRSGAMKTLSCTLTDANYSFDIYTLIEDMNLLSTGDYKVPDKYKGRMRDVNGVLNFRDFGGIPLEDGGTTAYGILYRSAALEDIKPDGITYVKQTLGVRTDIDLRDPSTGEARGYTPLGEGVTYFNRLGPWYVVGDDGIKNGNKRANLLEILKMFVNKKNYPMIFHCQVGRDRTGTVGAVLAGLAGATMKGMYEDYLISFYASCCHSGGYSASGMAGNIIQMYEFLSSYKSTELSLSENTAAFLVNLGMSEEQVSTLKEILLTGDITVSETTNPGMGGGTIEGVGDSGLE